MANHKLIQFFSVLVFLMLAFKVAAQNFPEQPDPPRLVNDFSRLLNDASRNELERSLVQFNNETSTQIAIVTIDDLNGYDIADYAFRLAEKWGIGQKGKNNGILILVKPKNGNEKGQVFIATGYGLEGAVPDAVAHRIVDFEIIPRFRQNDYAGGLKAAVTTLMELTKGEYTADNYMNKTKDSSEHVGGVIFLLFFFAVLFIVVKGQKTKSSSIGGSDLPFWVLMSMLGSSGRHSGRWDSFSSGSGSFRGGSFGGGGFGGFGGGSFGGGGAGGSW